jgi:hypothetical protein
MNERIVALVRAAHGSPLFTQNTIPVFGTLIKRLTQNTCSHRLFKRYGVNESEYWAEPNALVEE